VATVRHHIEIARPPDDVWSVIRDVGAIADWWPSMVASAAVDGGRTCDLASGITLREETVTCDDDLRRFQYRLAEGVPVESHLATVDVIPAGSGSLVIYSTDVEPPAIAMVLDGPILEALAELKAQLEG
jgi:carbon monoxide dehydrogenase subunit G